MGGLVLAGAGGVGTAAKVFGMASADGLVLAGAGGEGTAARVFGMASAGGAASGVAPMLPGTKVAGPPAIDAAP